MFKALKVYFVEDVGPRFWEILFSVETGLAVLAGWAAIRFCSGMDDPTRLAVISAGLSYASIAFGFCIAGMTIALTLPDRNFAVTLAKRHPNGSASDSYSALLFVFSWTAVVHWAAIILFIVALMLPKAGLAADLPDWLSKAFLGLTGAVSALGLIQFLLTVMTLTQVGKAYIKNLLKVAEAPEQVKPAARRRKA